MKCKACIEADELMNDNKAEKIAFSCEQLRMALHLKRWHCECKEEVEISCPMCGEVGDCTDTCSLDDYLKKETP